MSGRTTISLNSHQAKWRLQLEPVFTAAMCIVVSMGRRGGRRRERTKIEPNRDSTGRRKTSALVLAILAALTAIGLANSSLSRRRDTPLAAAPTVYSYQVVNSFPHDKQAFCQGLDFDGTTLFESTGQYGQSSVRRVNLETGKVEKQLRLDRRLFGEGLTLFDDRVIQVTWKRRLGYIYDAKTLKLRRTFRYDGEGWGLTHDGNHLIMSDGSDKLKFLDPVSFTLVRTIRVKDGGRPVRRLNELEYVRGEILANVWHSDRIAMIAPDTGKVNGWIDLSGLRGNLTDPEAVLNGIAFEDGRLFVTGKYWPRLFEIQLLKRQHE